MASGVTHLIRQPGSPARSRVGGAAGLEPLCCKFIITGLVTRATALVIFLRSMRSCAATSTLPTGRLRCYAAKTGEGALLR